jgi:hypothetical protein
MQCDGAAVREANRKGGGRAWQLLRAEAARAARVRGKAVAAGRPACNSNPRRRCLLPFGVCRSRVPHEGMHPAAARAPHPPTWV